MEDVRCMLHSISLTRTFKKKDVQENLIWLDYVVDLDAARSRINQMASTPGEYFVFDQRTRQIAATLQLSSPEF